MFTKENIIIQNETLQMLNPKCDMLDYTKSTNDLYYLITNIIKELEIISLSKVTIKDVNLFEREAGNVLFCVNDGIVCSEIELSRKTYAQFNSEKNIELKNEALATIYHELYHIYDKENLYHKFKNVEINPKEIPYYKIGIQYWGEFFAYYKTKELHFSDYPIRQFDTVYHSIQKDNLSQEIAENFFYIISNICAYTSDKKYLNKLEDITYFKYVKKDRNYTDLVDKLNEIILKYPENINDINIFINLGKIYCKLFEFFHYKIDFKNNNMISTKFTNF